MRQVYEQILVPLTTTVAAGGGTVSGQWIDIGETESALSLVLEGAGSTSVTVTYSIGCTKAGYEGHPKNQNKSDVLQSITPNDAGACSASLTTCNIAAATGNRLHGTVTPVPCRWVKFTLTNNDGANALTNCKLIGLHQK